MKKYSGNLLSYLNEQTKEAVAEAQSAAQTVEIQMIDANDIIPNTQNFYGIRDIEKLAKSMALSNHVSPLEVLAQDDGKYRLLSGERRRAAVLLRKERGEIEDTHVPCIVREPFVGVDGLTAEQMEMISIISANDYREKTPFEQLDEILKLEPIARVLYERNAQNSIDADGNTIKFRKFFSEKFLGLSETTLHRILAFQKLLPEARAAFEAGKVSKTALTYLPGIPPEQQAAYFEALDAGTAQGTIAGVQAFISANSGEDSPQTRWESILGEGETTEPVEPTEPANPAGPSEPSDSFEPSEGESPVENTDEPKKPKEPRPPKPPAEDTNVMPDFPTDINPDISPAEVEKDANNWVIESLNCMADMAEQKSKKAADDGHNREAKLWNLRKAAVELVIETIS